MPVSLDIDGEVVDVEASQDDLLLWVLRNALRKNGPKYGCGAAQCGACTVLANGIPIRSCVFPLSALADKKIETLDGLRAPDGGVHALQAAFILEQAAQCGYCSAGVIMTAAALLRANPAPSDQQVRQALDGNLCRCGSHNRVVRAVLRAADMMAGR